jgi:hypothetical protein
MLYSEKHHFKHYGTRYVEMFGHSVYATLLKQTSSTSVRYIP